LERVVGANAGGQAFAACPRFHLAASNAPLFTAGLRPDASVRHAIESIPRHHSPFTLNNISDLDGGFG
jgi:hypothetical protein